MSQSAAVTAMTSPAPGPLAAPPAPTASPAPPTAGWPLWRRQTAAIIRLELRKGFAGRRAIGLYLLALAPAAVFLMRMLAPRGIVDPGDVGDATVFMAQVYQDFILPVVVFLGCVLVFGNLIRREVLDRSLHFYFLSPVRREVLVVAKYLTGLIVTTLIFGVSTLVCFVLVYLPHDSRLRDQFLFHGPGLAHLGSYLLVTALGCAGYGAVFLTLSFFFRSPALPALGIFAWELMHFLLPPALKQLAVVHYLQALCPVPVSQGPFALLADSPSKTASILGLLIFSLLLLGIAAWRARRMEVSYLDD